jgi:uncharacterized glyoxalase superfamily protein PhnB
MNEAVQLAGGRSSPGLRYRDVGAAIVWLSTAFGFERRSVVADGAGHVSYAELSFGNTIIMLGAVKGFEIDRYMAQPDDIGGAETQCCYYVVEDIEAHYAKARNAGCEIVINLKTGAVSVPHVSRSGRSFVSLGRTIPGKPTLQRRRAACGGLLLLGRVRRSGHACYVSAACRGVSIAALTLRCAVGVRRILAVVARGIRRAGRRGRPRNDDQ